MWGKTSELGKIRVSFARGHRTHGGGLSRCQEFLATGYIVMLRLGRANIQTL